MRAGYFHPWIILLLEYLSPFECLLPLVARLHCACSKVYFWLVCYVHPMCIHHTSSLATPHDRCQLILVLLPAVVMLRCHFHDPLPLPDCFATVMWLCHCHTVLLWISMLQWTSGLFGSCGGPQPRWLTYLAEASVTRGFIKQPRWQLCIPGMLINHRPARGLGHCRLASASIKCKQASGSDHP